MEQNSLPRVKVVNPNDGWIGTEYYINGKKIDRVKSVDFRVAVDEVPTFTFETIGAPDIDMHRDIRFSFTPETVTEAAKVLRNELLKHGDLYDGFLASIKSAVAEYAAGCHCFGGDYEILSEEIANRIIGEE